MANRCFDTCNGNVFSRDFVTEQKLRAVNSTTQNCWIGSATGNVSSSDFVTQEKLRAINSTTQKCWIGSATGDLNMNGNNILNVGTISYTNGTLSGVTGPTGPGGGGGGGGSTPGGPTNSLQYNNDNLGITGSEKLIFDPSLNNLALNGSLNFTTVNQNIAILGGTTTVNQSGSNAIAIGIIDPTNPDGPSMINQGNNTISIGISAGQFNQAQGGVAIGQYVGYTGQGAGAFAMGNYAGYTNQGDGAFACGFLTGAYDQGNNAIAMGVGAGQNLQGINSIAMGVGAAYYNQGTTSIAIGSNSAYLNQGVNSIAIGNLAGYTDQAANSIILNATGMQLNNPATTNALYVAPVRNDNSVTAACCYNTETKEITYSTSGTKTFVIEHPLDQDKYLVHACLEGPEAGVYYRGTATIPAEESVIELTLPAYVDDLATEFTVHITPVETELEEENLGNPAFITLSASRVRKGKFKVYKKNISAFLEWNMSGKNKRETAQAFDYLVFGKRLTTMEVEPLKSAVEVKGNGPYCWI